MLCDFESGGQDESTFGSVRRINPRPGRRRSTRSWLRRSGALAPCGPSARTPERCALLWDGRQDAGAGVVAGRLRLHARDRPVRGGASSHHDRRPARVHLIVLPVSDPDGDRCQKHVRQLGTARCQCPQPCRAGERRRDLSRNRTTVQRHKTTLMRTSVCGPDQAGGAQSGRRCATPSRRPAPASTRPPMTAGRPERQPLGLWTAGATTKAAYASHCLVSERGTSVAAALATRRRQSTAGGPCWSKRGLTAGSDQTPATDERSGSITKW